MYWIYSLSLPPPSLEAPIRGGAQFIFWLFAQISPPRFIFVFALAYIPTLNTEIPKFYSHQDTTH